MRKTKIICTLGPATADDAVLEKLMLRGMNVARLNFSHGDHEQHANTLKRIEALRTRLNVPVASLLDTRGPEIRLGNFRGGKTLLEKNQRFTLTTREIAGSNEVVSITYKELPKDVVPGMKILIDDGLIELDVDEVSETDIVCTVVNAGAVSDHKGVNVPDCNLSMPFLDEKDYADIVFGIGHGVDFIAASFTRTAEDILEIRKILEKYNRTGIKLIAKIENKQGVDNIDRIIEAADGIMVARGDMGVEIPFEDVPVLQKKIIKKAAIAGKVVITATQMLDSMMKNPRPTRAEATDVANAIYDGTAAIMLSGETAAGAYPVEALETMVRIAERAEEDISYSNRFYHYKKPNDGDVTSAISHATCSTAIDLDSKAIISITESGRTARMISRYRPSCPIIGCTFDEQVWRQLNLEWGVIPLKLQSRGDYNFNTEELFCHAIGAACSENYIDEGDLTVITASLPLGGSGKTNILKVNV